MNEIKKCVVTVSVITGILFIMLLCIYLFPKISMLIISKSGENPAQPQITYGEFPFRLEYRIEDKTIVVEDVIICEYDGIKWNEGRGKYRAWRKKLKQSGEENVLIIEDGEQKIYCNVGSADYYMNDQKYPTESPLTPNLYPIVGGEFHTEKEIMDKYKIELIKWEFAEPIKNSFK